MPDMDSAMPGDTGAGDALAAPPQMGDSPTVTIPMDLLPGCKAGDTYTVKSMDDSNVVLEKAPGDAAGDDDDWGAGLKQAAPDEV